MDGVRILPIRQGLLFDRSDELYPTRAFGWCEKSGALQLGEDYSSYFGYVVAGIATLELGAQCYSLTAGQYFCAPRHVSVRGGRGVIVERGQQRALPLIGGPIESWGRLKYIDGCTDTLLLPPVRYGDACLNALFFPERIEQTLHNHPSDRLGVVAAGHGICRSPSGMVDLEVGKAFLIERNAIHAFSTPPGEAMTVIAYHPDSDFGPMDEDHPMINRTFVGGVSASSLEEIRTR
ncbi:MAG TPA: hypothetical protein VIC29_15245 [Steroidobacteraceae bacterium]|jgi:hypothetical protein